MQRDWRSRARRPARARAKVPAMTSPLVDIAWEPCLLVPARDPEFESALRREAGSAPGWVRYFLPCPWAARAMLRGGPENGLLIALDFATVDLVGLVVSQEHSCRFCYASVRALLRVFGMSEERLQMLERQLAVPDLEPRQAAAVRFARRMARANPPATPADHAPLAAVGFDAGQIRELAYVVSALEFMNRMTTIPAIPPQLWEQLPDRWFVRLLRPLLARIVQKFRRRGKPVPVTPTLAGPFADLLQVYAGSPIGPRIAATLDDLWNSTLLPRRGKALMFAVIGRAVGSEPVLREARAILLEQGMSVADIDDVLMHLRGATLDARELALMQFARESVRYEPAAIQRRARELGALLPVPALVEAVAVAAFANALARLACALLPP